MAVTVDRLESQCAGKKGFDSFSKAKECIRRQGRTVRNGSGYMQPYRCPHCNMWHLGGGKERRP